MEKSEHKKWAHAIAQRISDEWNGATDFPEDAKLLRNYLQKSLENDSVAVTSFIGTGIIEEDYFEKI